jgi:hypothetical protein
MLRELVREFERARMSTTWISRSRRRLGATPPNTIPQGAATTLWAGVIADADKVGGRYCEDCDVAQVPPDDVAVSPLSSGVRSYALDLERAKQLWTKSEELVGETF